MLVHNIYFRRFNIEIHTPTSYLTWPTISYFTENVHSVMVSQVLVQMASVDVVKALVLVQVPVKIAREKASNDHASTDLFRHYSI